MHSQETGEFPSQEGAMFPVLNPDSDARFQWDCYLMVLIIYVMLVTPFQLSYLDPPAEYTDTFSNGGGNKYMGLWCSNLFVDLAFVVDLFLAFNTAYVDPYTGGWVMDRFRIGLLYGRTWFVIDFLSVLPYNAIGGGNAGLLKMLKMVRLLKLFRVFKQPRIMARIAARNTMRAGEQAILKYSMILFFLLHWTACAVRMIGAMTLAGCHTKTPGNLNAPEIRSGKCGESVLWRYWNRGIWAQYIAAMVWALATLQGDVYATSVAETTLVLIVGLLGCIVMAFLIGDLCNVVGNMDPVGNDYSLTQDTLNNWFDSARLPADLRRKLREYMGLAEKAFRDAHNKATFGFLSPPLKAMVMHHTLEREIANIPFYMNAVLQNYALKPGRRLSIFPPILQTSSADEGRKSARATLIEVDVTRLQLCVKYDDGRQEEDVPVSRIDPMGYRLGAKFELRMAHFIFQHNSFVLLLSTLFTTKFFMAKDVICHANLSTNTEMFTIASGKALMFGEKSVNPIDSFCVKRIYDTVGEDICLLLIGDKAPKPRHYAVRSTAVTECHVTDGVLFTERVSSPSFSTFYKQMRLHAYWLFIRGRLISAIRRKFSASAVKRGARTVLPKYDPEKAATPADVSYFAKNIYDKLFVHLLSRDDTSVNNVCYGRRGHELLAGLKTLQEALQNPADARRRRVEALLGGDSDDDMKDPEAVDDDFALNEMCDDTPLGSTIGEYMRSGFATGNAVTLKETKKADRTRNAPQPLTPDPASSAFLFCQNTTLSTETSWDTSRSL